MTGSLGHATGRTAAALVVAVGLVVACEEAPPAPKAEPAAPAKKPPAPPPVASAPPVEDAGAPRPKKDPKDCPKSATVEFDHPAIEQEIRYKLGKKTGSIAKSELGTIKSINLAQVKLEQLDPCVFPLFKGVRSLYLGAGSIDDLTPIESLTKLENLRISLNPITDLKPLAKMTKMDRLDLGHTKVADLSPLEGMTAMTDLQLDDTPVIDVTPLAKLTKLEQLSLQRTPVKDLAPLKTLTKLKVLRVAGVDADTFPLMPLAKEGLKIMEN